MTTNKLILIFLGIIFLIIIILGSNRIATSLRQRFAGFLPTTTPASNSVSFAEIATSPTLAPAKPTIAPESVKKIAGTTTSRSTASSEIPSTGPSELVWLFIGGSGLIGLSLRKLTSRTYNKTISFKSL